MTTCLDGCNAAKVWREYKRSGGLALRNKLMEAKKERAAILLISEDLDEILSLSDRVAPIYEGEFMGIVPGELAEREHIGAMMAGIKMADIEPEAEEK